jgi:hypothetical protein
MPSRDDPVTYEFTVSPLPFAAGCTCPYSWQEPVAGSVDVILATNRTDKRCDIGVGESIGTGLPAYFLTLKLGFPVDEHTSQVCRLFKDVGYAVLAALMRLS